ncbi:copper chaperone PCu(A)C [Salicola sp. Rm-C-2C1-2]|uniref:copper chaperone PCu(A)C n=1 Tax=Salicola sp. Rm-C-2C1-2 TaxID=3141321 RepID=UPI0032E3F3F9
MRQATRTLWALILLTTMSSALAEVRIKDAWSRATPPGIERGAGYMTLHNTGEQARTLTGASATWAQRIEIHESREVDGQMRMQALPDGLTLQPGESLELAPMGRHLMLMGLTERLTQGDTLALTLEFRNGGTLNTQLDVRGPDASTSQSSH